MGNNKNDNSDESRNMIRAGIYPMLGLYLIYLAYRTFNKIMETSNSEQIMMVVCSILFFICGVGVLLLGASIGFRISKKSKDDMEDGYVEDQSEEKKE